ncbi:hypothetical protein FBU31_001128 [Coemansia sp. 'formosensis']|nr:hypothetical protein FBU31_001128 [Coemansia sp. 'formosensis']
MPQDDMDYEAGINQEVEATEYVKFDLEVVDPNGPIKIIKLTTDSSAYVEVLGQLVDDYYGEKLELDTKSIAVIEKRGPRFLFPKSSFKSNYISNGSTLRVTLTELAPEEDGDSGYGSAVEEPLADLENDGDSGYGSVVEEPLADLENDGDSGYGSVVEEESKKVSMVSIKIEQESDKDESDDNMRYYDRSKYYYDPADYYEDDDY